MAAMYACTGASPSAFAIRGLPPARRVGFAATAERLLFATVDLGTASCAGSVFASAFVGLRADDRCAGLKRHPPGDLLRRPAIAQMGEDTGAQFRQAVKL